MERFDHSFFDTVYSRQGTGSMKYDRRPAGAAEDLLPMWVADMDFPTSPVIVETLEKASQQGIFGYTDVGSDYWTLLVDWYARRMGWRADPDWFIPLPNVLSAVSAGIQMATEPGDGVLLCQPVYHLFASIVKGLRRRLMVSPLHWEDGRYTMDFDDLERQLQQKECKVFLLCSPHNPGGRVWTREELTRLVELCCRYDITIISDEIHADLVYTPNRHIPIAAVSEEAAARSITCMAPTKTFNLAGVPTAQAIIPNAALRSRFREICAAVGHGSGGIMPLAASRAAYSCGEPWLEGLLDYLRGNLDLLLQSFPAGAPINASDLEGTYLAWLDCRSLGLDSSGLDDLFLKKAGVWLNNGAMFGQGGEGFMRLNFACPRSVLSEGIRRIRRAVGME
ncbi:MAG: pyridoxal phosphate-dependent aminotransferase [Ruminococcaceae bacterium]|jgi:cystathionine beta-lyase|nr:pyridoxal phosphate-dependent aminotransferase [Oscillospiraceae bacterium]